MTEPSTPTAEAKSKYELENVKYRYLGNFSAVDPAYSRGMSCSDCKVEWIGCWDNFMCPECGEGELPGCNPMR